MPSLPTNPHAIGDSGHVNDHNTIVTALADGVYKTPSADQTITSDAATRKPLAIKGHSSQSANLQEWQNSSGTALAYVSSAGNIIGGGLNYVGSYSVTNQPNFTTDGVFTTEYEHYKIVLVVTPVTAGSETRMVLRASGTDTTSGYFTMAYGTNTSGVANGTGAANIAYWIPGLPNVNNVSDRNIAVFDLLSPKASVKTTAAGTANYQDSSGIMTYKSFTLHQSGTTAFDGIKVYQSSGNLDCSLKIWGYRTA